MTRADCRHAVRGGEVHPPHPCDDERCVVADPSGVSLVCFCARCDDVEWAVEAGVQCWSCGTTATGIRLDRSRRDWWIDECNAVSVWKSSAG